MARYPKMNDPGGKNVIPSVTEIIGDCTDKSGALTQWAANMCKEWVIENCEWDTWEDDISEGWFTVRDTDLNDMRFNFKKVSQKALDIGSEVHNAIEKHLQGKIFRLSTTEAKRAFGAFLAWADEHNLKPIHLEQTVYSHDGSWAGTLDIDCWLNGKRYIIDLKTSKAFYPEHRYQVAAYRIAVEDVTQDEENYPQGCGILRLDKETGLPSWHDTSKTFEKDLLIFNAMFELYKLRHPIIMKRARG